MRYEDVADSGYLSGAKSHHHVDREEHSGPDGV
jgi:hypothetical protein